MKRYAWIFIILFAISLINIGCTVVAEEQTEITSRNTTENTTQSNVKPNLEELEDQIASTIGYGVFEDEINMCREDPQMGVDIWLDVEDVSTPDLVIIAVKKLFADKYGEDLDYVEYADDKIVIQQDMENHVWYAYSFRLGRFGGGYACLIDYDTGEVIGIWRQK